MTALTSLRSRISTEFLRDPNYRIRPTTVVDQAINDAQTRMRQRLWSMVNDKTSTITTVAWTQEYTAPTDLGRSINLTFNGVTLYETTLEELRTLYPEFGSGKPTHYYIRPWLIWLYPIPNVVWTVNIYYTQIPPTITTSQDSTTPAYMDYALLLLASSILYSQVNPDKAQYFMALSEKAFWEAFAMILRDENLRF